jgi:hypothetical protein
MCPAWTPEQADHCFRKYRPAGLHPRLTQNGPDIHPQQTTTKISCKFAIDKI